MAEIDIAKIIYCGILWEENTSFFFFSYVEENLFDIYL